jgi:hypothetical protein
MRDDIMVAIGRLEGKVDSLIVMIRNHEKTLERHDDRLRVLEHSKSHLLGWTSAVASVVAAAAAYVFSKIIHQ